MSSTTALPLLSLALRAPRVAGGEHLRLPHGPHRLPDLVTHADHDPRHQPILRPAGGGGGGVTDMSAAHAGRTRARAYMYAQESAQCGRVSVAWRAGLSVQARERRAGGDRVRRARETR